MKTIFLSAAILLATVTGILTSAKAAVNNAGETYTTLAETGPVTGIEVYGNVELYLSNGNTGKVKVYNDYYKDNAVVLNHNGTLRISSYKKDKLVVWVTVNDLRSIVAYNNAVIKSFGKISAINLTVKLFDQASAKLNIDAYQADFTLNGNAAANLAGNINNCALKYDLEANINTRDLSWASLVMKDARGDMMKQHIADFAAL
ncbi:MAG TPA: DUF2807 domain-containing protein [Mucilaginibacter sp.]|nr:DUF2807 domain-containing protein [Mucilaginibacter sp.]